MKDFEALYDQYRDANDIPKPARRSEKLYDSIFKEHRYRVSRPDRITIGRIEYHREEVICGMCLVQNAFGADDAEAGGQGEGAVLQLRTTSDPRMKREASAAASRLSFGTPPRLPAAAQGRGAHPRARRRSSRARLAAG